MLKLKAKSNLRLNPTFDLSLKEKKQGFLGLYLNSQRLNPMLFLRLWATGRSRVLDVPDFGRTPAARRSGARALLQHTPSGLIRIRKENDHFLVWLPVAFISPNSAPSIMEAFMAKPKKRGQVEQPEPEDTDIDTDEPEEISVPGLEAPPGTQPEAPTPGDARYDFSVDLTPGRMTGHEAISRLTKLPAEVRVALSKSLQEVTIEPASSERVVVMLKFIISKAEAQYMANLPWVQVRNIDLYSMLQTWALQGYGGASKRRPPRASMPVSEIARSIPSDPERLTYKTNEHGLSIDSQGHLLYVPRELDNTRRYEDAFLQAGTIDDSGDFQLMRLGEEPTVKLPANLPVLVDWVNSKFSYTNTSGMLQVMDLTRNIAANATHINSWLNKPIESKHILNILRLAEAAGVALTREFEESDWAFYFDDEVIPVSEGLQQTIKSSDFNEFYIGLVQRLVANTGQIEHLSYGHLASNSAIGPLRPIGRLFERILSGISERLESAYQKYSISFVTHNMSYLILIGLYAKRWEDVKIEDQTDRRAALGQGVDENWEPEPLPLIADGIGRLPHQRKIANLMRGSPRFAILPVQAGGGKSMLIITDILQELKRGNGHPYLILCPRHLLSNYVEEFTFFSKGRLNFIGISTYTINKNGLDRLLEIIQRSPRNTVVVTSYENLAFRAEQICYGTTSTTVFPVVEMLRRVGFGYVALDESHYVKNVSARSASTMSLIADIRMKRLASGTMNHDSPSDLAVQIAMMDPTLFGSRDEFNERFGEEVRGGRVIQWKPSAHVEINRLIKERIVVAGAQRKEWAALLPPTTEQFHRVNLTQEQYRVYGMILREAVEEIERNAELMRKIEEAKQEEGENAVEESASLELEELLKPYLQRLERFVNAPAADELGNLELKGEDRVSPKALMVNELIRNHIADDVPGKVMVFTNYTVTAEEIYATLDPEIQARTILYKAASKTEDLARFQSDDRLIAMVGVEQSMNTGLNLQSLSRLIRVETVWNPGTLEQGNSRLNRPQLKTDEERARIYYDWIVADNTIDITKVSRLLSKQIAVAKFENSSNPAYSELPDLPIIGMSLDNIESLNNWESVLPEYWSAYTRFTRVQKEEFAKYRAQFIAKYGTDFMAQIEEAEAAPDLALIPDAPYIPGMFLPNADELGLIRLDLYISSLDSRFESSGDSDEEDGGTEDGELDLQFLRGLRVHTEFGEGVINRWSTKVRNITVHLDDGRQVRVAWSSAFVNPKHPELLVDVKAKLFQTLDMPVGPRSEEPPAQVMVRRLTRKELREIEQEKKRQQDEQAAKMQGNIYLSITNGFPSLVYYTEENPDLDKALEALGFRPSIPFYYAHLPNALALKRQIELWNKKGFIPDPEMVNEMQAIYDLYHLLKEQKLRSGQSSFRLANRNELRNFYRMNHKPNSDASIIRPYPVIEDGEAYLVLPIVGQVGTQKAIRVRAPRIIWEKSEPSLAYYAVQPGKIQEMVKKIQDAGITILNAKELMRQVTRIRKMKVRDRGVLEV